MKSRPQPFRHTVLATLASVLAVGALAPQVSPAARGTSQGAQIGAAAPGSSKQAAAPAQSYAPGTALRALLSDGGGMEWRDPGCPPDVWGQSAACYRMRMKNVRAGRVAHYRPRARA